MSHPARPFHPRWHRVRTPIFWWLRKLSYARFIARELTSLGVAYAAVLLLALCLALARGDAAFATFERRLASPAALALHGLLLAVLLFHTLTWLHLAPKAMVVRLGGRRVPDGALLAAHYLGWAAVTAGIALWLLGERP